MKIGIIGTGAVASLFAHRLAGVADVTLLGTWQAQIDAINQNGLTLIELDDTSSTQYPKATAQYASVSPVDLVLVLVKSYQTAAVIERIAAVVAADSVIVTLQNGLGNVEQLSAEFGNNFVTAGTSSYGALMVTPGTVRYTGEGGIQLALPAQQFGRIKPTLSLLQQAGFAIETVPTVNSTLWGKVAINVGINPLTALMRVPNGYLATNEKARAVMLAAARQTQAIAAAHGIQLPYKDAGLAALAVAEATATNLSSMQQDLAHGRRTEIEAICGVVVRSAESLNISCPTVRALYDGVVSAEKNPNVAPEFDIETILHTI